MESVVDVVGVVFKGIHRLCCQILNKNRPLPAGIEPGSSACEAEALPQSYATALTTCLILGFLLYSMPTARALWNKEKKYSRQQDAVLALSVPGARVGRRAFTRSRTKEKQKSSEQNGQMSILFRTLMPNGFTVTCHRYIWDCTVD